MRPLSINLPSWFNRSYFQPLFTTLSRAHLSSRVYTTSRIILLYRLAQTIMLFANMFDYNISVTLYFYLLRYFDLSRASRIVHQSSVQCIWMISTSRVVTPRATCNLRPLHGVSTPIWLCSVNCYCFAPHHKSLSLLYLFSLSTPFFPKIDSRCICRMAIYTPAWVAGARKILETI